MCLNDLHFQPIRIQCYDQSFQFSPGGGYGWDLFCNLCVELVGQFFELCLLRDSKEYFCVLLCDGLLGHTELLVYLPVSMVNLLKDSGVEILQCSVGQLG